MKADFNHLYSRHHVSSLSEVHSAWIIPAMQMFLVEKKLLIIDQRNVAPCRKYRGVVRRLGQV